MVIIKTINLRPKSSFLELVGPFDPLFVVLSEVEKEKAKLFISRRQKVPTVRRHTPIRN